jgi:hypothetical protein
MQGDHSLLVQKPFFISSCGSNNTILDPTGSSTCDTVLTLLCGLIVMLCVCWFFERETEVSELRPRGQDKGVLVDKKEKDLCTTAQKAFYCEPWVSPATMETHTLLGKRHENDSPPEALDGDETSVDDD